ncbi:hypothetical protein ARAM_004497 [Aspergillus rambellii]|uniref:Uncharacterized protein n=2 Tax=Aspergillus subgen. Nidulantes TaxID=2720870 RepID=A0A0F8UMZ6_9EURO|nr:hypothetical protein AOCH_004970 [Aspergillus ochraceoroseus]KKK20908.1 hypothetical protein ARAM_004497 [Aspergillus rambellii]
MLPRQPGSPLALETCSNLAPNLDDEGVIDSDDGLDKVQRTARRQRIEELAEAYLEGTPLFILSASLRGPFGKDWNNPWKKDGSKITNGQRSRGRSSKEKEQPTQPSIPETQSGKRRQPPDLPAASRPTQSKTQLTPSYTRFVQKSAAGTRSESPRVTHVDQPSKTWLRKDNVSTRFQNIDPPTSPTTSISSRHNKRKGNLAKTHPTCRREETAEPEPARSLKSPQPKQSNQSGRTPQNLPGQGISSTGGRHTSNLNTSYDQQADEGNSLHVASSSSQLPKFEYRLKKNGATDAHADKPISDGIIDGRAKGQPPRFRGSSSNENIARSPSMHGPRHSQPEDITRTFDDSMTLANASGTIENPSMPNLEKPLPSDPQQRNTSENLPSAQHVRENPPTHDNITSLYSIAISKGNSDRTDDHNIEPQLSTQAAVLMAQKSFQHDLDSPKCRPLASGKKRRAASRSSNHHSPNSVNITPFHHINTPNQALVGERPNALGNSGAQFISTQYMIDAITPFTFSADKRADRRSVSSRMEGSRTKKQKTTSFALYSPSEMPSEHPKSDQESCGSISPHEPECHKDATVDSHKSILPMTTGTTPQTAQDGQGAESFNLSQAIAEAGSWLQQSFEITKDIHLPRNLKPHTSTETAHSS